VFAPDRGGHALGVLASARSDRDPRARLRKGERDRLADALAGTGDDGDLAVQPGDAAQGRTPISRMIAAVPV
jgi:hypothetical protein